jgi:hypothetical protein
MTEARNSEHDPEVAEQTDQDPEAKPEVIKDLDVTSDDADVIPGGMCGKSYGV